MNLLTSFGVQNLDIFIIGLVAIGIGTLGFVAYFSNPKSITNKTFLGASITVILWGGLNLIVFRMGDPNLILWTLRFAVFFATWHAFSAFQLFYVFPKSTVIFPWWYFRLLVPVVAAVSLLTLTPLVFSGVGELVAGKVGTVINGPAIPVFGLTVILLHALGLLALFRKIVKTERQLRTPYLLIFVGATITYVLIIIFNFIFPALLNRPEFAAFAGVFTFPFIGFTAYAIIKHRLFNIKVVATELLAAALALVTLLELFTADTLEMIIFRITIFALVLGFSYLLIRSVIREVQQREHIEQLAKELQAANNRLKELDRLKSEFLSIASHDLRTPITAIRNFVSLLREGMFGKVPAAAEDGLRQVFERATDMTKLIENYLNVSRIEQGKMKYEFANADFTRMVQDAVSFYKAGAEKKNLVLTLSVAPGAEKLPVKVDTSKINEVVNNLIDNSIKYTMKGSIALTLEKVGGKARLTLKDTGVGMSQKTTDGLFKLFSPGEDSKKVNPDSTGVGLYITKAHVVAHKGTLTASSPGEGKGSQFVVELPLV